MDINTAYSYKIIKKKVTTSNVAVNGTYFVYTSVSTTQNIAQILLDTLYFQHAEYKTQVHVCLYMFIHPNAVLHEYIF